jgi:hypothetical protein
MDEPLVWHVSTHEHRDHTADWYWGLALASLAGIIVSIWLGNFLLAVIIALAALSIVTLSMRGPREHQVRIDGRGVTIDGTLYRYSNIQSFWVAVDEPLPERSHELQPRIWLYITTSGYLHPHITIPIESMHQGHEVRDRLLKFVDEEEQHPHFGEHLAELLGL